MADIERSRDRFGLVFALILLSLVLSASVGGQPWSPLARVVVHGVTLLVALRASVVSKRTYAIAVSLVGVAIVLMGVASATGTTTLAIVVSAGIMGVLVVATPVAVIQRLRGHDRVTAQTVFGALSVYMLIGLFYATVYGTIAALSSAPFFAQVPHASSTDIVYFSYVTLSTTGFGDLTPAGSTGRMIAVSEALVGQLYLVTVVALLVSNIGHQRPQRPSGGTSAS